MHELSIAQNIIDILDETFSNNKYKKLLEVKVQVGEMIAVVPDSLQFCYECLIKDTPYEKSRLKIEVLPGEALCRECKHLFNTKDFYFICPKCQATDIEILQGKELKISQIEVE